VKTILGWILYTLHHTISLPSHRRERILELLSSIAPTQKRVSLKKWQQLLGELHCHWPIIRSPSGLAAQNHLWITSALDPAYSSVPGGLPVALQRRHLPSHHRIRNCADVKPSTRGAADASTKGMGGVHFVPTRDGSVLPLLWRASWLLSVQNRLVSHDNQSGDVNNSELELAASVSQLDVLAQTIDIHEHTVHSLS
jgi:hypothetical protein